MAQYYSMTLVWSTYCKFIFNEWATESTITFLVGCLVTMLLSVFSMALPKIKGKIQKMLFSYDSNSSVNEQYESVGENIEPIQKQSIRMTTKQLVVKKRIIPFFYSLIYSLLHVVIMIIMMSMNAWVILAIILGYTLGFYLFSESCRLKKGSKCSGGCHEKN